MTATRKKWKGSEFVYWRGRVYRVLGFGRGDRTQEDYVRVAGGTADFETGQFLIIRRPLRPISFCNCKYLNIGHFPSSAGFYTSTYYQSE